jgi:hypothetical protein
MDHVNFKWRNMKNKKVLILIGLLSFLSSCETEKKETFNEHVVDLNQDYQVLISSHVTKKEYRGAITNIDYGSSVNAKYNLKIKHKNRTLINSNLGSEEPKHLLICPDDIWLHLVGEYYRKQDITVEADKEKKVDDVKAQEPVDEYVMEIGASYKKLKDERYIFHLFGDIFWINEEAKIYNEKLSNNDSCVEYPLPGANIFEDIR